MQAQATQTARTNQSPTAAKDFERRSLECARLGLMQRGADRFATLALASTYALAARDAALNAGGVR